MSPSPSDIRPRSVSGRLISRAARLLHARVAVYSPDFTLRGGAPLLDDPRVGKWLRTLASESLAGRLAVERRIAPGFFAWAVPGTRGPRPLLLLALLEESRMRRSTLPPAVARRDLASFLEALIDSVSEEIAAAEAREISSERLTAAEADAALLHRVSERLADPADPRESLRFILDGGRLACAAEFGLIALRSNSGLIVSRNEPGGSGIPSPAVLRHAAELLNDRLGSRPRGLLGSHREIFGAASPLPDPTQVVAGRLRVGNRRAGLMAFFRRGCIPFAERESGLVEALCGQASLAVRGGEMYADLNEFLLQTMKTLVGVIERKDEYTSGHSGRVHVVAMLLGRESGLPRRQRETLKWASILHDVGKIGLPETILSKAGALTAEEYEVVKQHPRRGYELLQPIPQLRDAAQAILLHHERIDGHGYPLGLAGDAIPLPARIIAVADTFDALTTTRPYRVARPAAEALQEIERVAGRQLDRDIVGSLRRMLPYLTDRGFKLAPVLRERRDRLPSSEPARRREDQAA